MSSFNKTTGLLILAMTLMASCKEKSTPTESIIVEKPVEVVSDSIIASSDYNAEQLVEWNNTTYTVTVNRKTDKSQIVTDAEGRNFSDNIVVVKVIREDGTVFYEHTFAKSDFAAFVTAEYLQHNVLNGVVFDQAEEERLILVGSVGSPDELSDEYIPFNIYLSRKGTISIERRAQLD